MINLYYPLLDVNITSYFGNRKDPFGNDSIKQHNGIDFATPEGTDIMASADGLVIWNGYSGSLGKWNEKEEKWDKKPSGFGNSVFILHEDGYITGYAHLQDYNVKYGQYVKQGEVIGHSGNTGGSTGPHLHFELIDGKQRRQDGKTIARAIAEQGEKKCDNNGTKHIGINGSEGRVDPLTGKTAKELEDAGICYPSNNLNQNKMCSFDNTRHTCETLPTKHYIWRTRQDSKVC